MPLLAPELFPLIKNVNEDHDAIEIVSKHGNAVLVSAEDYAALREGAYLLRSPASARRLLSAYENALNGVHVAEHDLVGSDAADPQRPVRLVLETMAGRTTPLDSRPTARRSHGSTG